MSGAAKPSAIVLMGPTASGKTAAALALAERLPVEIVSVDSALVYRQMDIGTAKPSAAEQAAVPHHLIDVIDPPEAYSAARFREEALAAMVDITARGRLPLLVGGTMLYYKALRDGLSDLPQANPCVRAELDERAAIHGWPRLHAELAAVDPETAARLKPTDAQRIQRALEIYALSGRPMSALLAEQAAAASELPFTLHWIALAPSDRSVLHQRIAERFDAMLAQGLVEELVALRARFPLQPEMPSMRCVGYRQAWDYLEGEISRDELRDRGIFATRQLAKRQITWLNQFPAHTIDCLAGDATTQVAAAVERALQA